MQRNILHVGTLAIFLGCFVFAAWFVYSEIYTVEAQYTDTLTFTVASGESAASLATRLEGERVIRHAWLFRKYLSWRDLDTRIHAGTFVVEQPITMERVATALAEKAAQEEREITILPGWGLRDIAQYLEAQGIANEDDVYAIAGVPAQQGGFTVAAEFENHSRLLVEKPEDLSIEGYLAPETYRVFRDEDVISILGRFLAHRESQMTDQLLADIRASGRSVHEVFTLASIVEREVRSDKDRALVADLFWRRYDEHWALQADSTVHYLTGKTGNVFTTKEDRDSLNPWNTYKYPGLPPGPISTPSMSSIRAVVYPEKNSYSYFLTTFDGEVRYAKTLEEHNANRQKYLQ